MRAACLAWLVFPVIGWGQNWQQMPDFPGTARDDAAAFGIGVNVYVGTGMEVGWGLTNDWYRFDGTTLQWSPVASLPASPRQYCSAFTGQQQSNTYGYLFGGLDANGPLNELWRYDPTSDSWSQMASLPGEPRYAAVAFYQGYIVTGLFDDGTATNELWKYDPNNDTWQQLTSMTGLGRHRACGLSYAGLMVVGGADSAYTALDDCWNYNTLTDSWTACASLPQGRYGAMCGFVTYDWILQGGATDTSTIVDSGFSYNLLTWQPLVDPDPGGTRRGGVLVEASGPGTGIWHTYLGLGISNSLVRKKDWYMAFGAFGISEQTFGELALHPNPGSTTFTLQLPDALHRSQLLVQDLTGRTVVNAPLVSPTVDASDWPGGSYLVEVIAPDGRRFRGRWVKL